MRVLLAAKGHPSECVNTYVVRLGDTPTKGAALASPFRLDGSIVRWVGDYAEYIDCG
jgi:hypothetical protein